MEAGAEPRNASLWRRILFSDQRTRVVWRILIWLIASAMLLFVLRALLSPYAAALDARIADEFTDELVAALAVGGAGVLTLTALDHRKPAAFGLAIEARSIGDVVRGFVGGGIVLTVAVGLTAPWGWQFLSQAGSTGDMIQVFWKAAALFLVAAASEEFIFRGYLFMALVERWGVWPATLFLSIGFAAFHLGNPSINALALVNIAVAGIFLSWVYLRTRSLWAAIGVHAGWNWMQGVVWDLPVSGLRLFDTPGYDVRVPAPSWIGGGIFGPEAGLAATVALSVATVWLVRKKHFKISERVRLARPLVETRMEKVA